MLTIEKRPTRLKKKNSHLAPQSHAIPHDAPDDNIFDNDNICDPTLRPKLSKNDGGISEDEHDTLTYVAATEPSIFKTI